jgi:hypothetical protein
MIKLLFEEHAERKPGPHHPLPEDVAPVNPLPVCIHKHAIFTNTLQVYRQ